MADVSFNGPVTSPDDGAHVPNDGELLKQFIDCHDDSAFADLVQTHGPMVLGVCRRVIGHQQDAEDAFQATFLVCARKARSICTQRTIAGWLYGVAYRTALKARNLAMKKKSRETPLSDELQATPSDAEQWEALRPLLDQELSRLPEHYRMPLVLCYLEGKSYGEVAAQLGCPEGTLSVRLMRAKTKLAEFLRRRGLVLTAASLGSLMTLGTATAATVPAALTTSTAQAATVFAVTPMAVAGLASTEVTTLANAVVKAMQLPSIVTMFSTAVCVTGLFVVAMNVWNIWNGEIENIFAIPSRFAKFDAPYVEINAPFFVDRFPSNAPYQPLADQHQSADQGNNAPSARVPETKQTNFSSDSDSKTDGGIVDSEWGAITGHVIVDGKVDRRKPLVTRNLAAVCANEDIPDETILIDPDSNGLANAIIWLIKPPKIHPALQKSKEREVIFDQKGCRFVPHVLLVRTDQQIRVLSNDAVVHNTHTYPSKNAAHNITIAANDRAGVLLPMMPFPERLPVKAGCDIHPWMNAWWIVLDHPYAAVTDKTGRFEITNLPVGDHEFRVWHETIGYIQKSYKVSVKPGKNPLPAIIVPAERFNR